jgi:hypothetical protein
MTMSLWTWRALRPEEQTGCGASNTCNLSPDGHHLSNKQGERPTEPPLGPALDDSNHRYPEDGAMSAAGQMKRYTLSLTSELTKQREH